MSDSLQPHGLSTPGFPVLHYLLEFAQIHVHWVGDAISSSASPLLILPLIFPSIRIFSNELGLHIKWPKYWSFSISPFNEYSGLIFFRIAWYDLLARVFSSTIVWKHQSFGAQPSLWSNSHLCTWLLGKPWLWHIYFVLRANLHGLSALPASCFSRIRLWRAGAAHTCVWHIASPWWMLLNA